MKDTIPTYDDVIMFFKLNKGWISRRARRAKRKMGALGVIGRQRCGSLDRYMGGAQGSLDSRAKATTRGS